MVAGAVASAVFAASTLPMLIKARRTRNLSSYSLGNIVLGNAGNALYTVYVLGLPLGPVWALHGFHTVSTGLMLLWYVRFEFAVRNRGRGSAGRLATRRPGRAVAQDELRRQLDVPAATGRTVLGALDRGEERGRGESPLGVDVLAHGREHRSNAARYRIVVESDDGDVGRNVEAAVQ